VGTNKVGHGESKIKWAAPTLATPGCHSAFRSAITQFSFAIFKKLFVPGYRITTAVGRTPPWGQAFPIRRQIPACVCNTIGIDSTDQAELRHTPFSTDFITSTASCLALHRRIYAEHSNAAEQFGIRLAQ